jgi:membrane peptidoglycan carboxypeptidase
MGVYLRLNEDSTFDLYQHTSSVLWSHYSGVFSLQGTTLTGKYADGTNWAEYTIKYNEKAEPKQIKLTRKDDAKDVAIYSATEIPAEVEEQASSYDLVFDGLDGVIYEESPAQASHFTNMREKVAGKTGTAERNNEEPTGWFVAFVPSNDPKYVVASCVEQGGYGSDSAMYVVRDIMGAIYDEPDDSTQVDTSGVR